MEYPDLTDEELTDIINRREVAGEVSARGEYEVLAIDVAGSWAAVFRFSLLASGDVDTETDIAELRPDGSWCSCGGGGIRSTGWDVPWSRPANGWDHGHLITIGLCGMNVEVDSEDVEIIAVSGFASGETDLVRVTTTGADRVIAPTATGAFVAVGFGRGFDFMKVTALKGSEPLSRAYSFPSRP